MHCRESGSPALRTKAQSHPHLLKNCVSETPRCDTVKCTFLHVQTLLPAVHQPQTNLGHIVGIEVFYHYITDANTNRGTRTHDHKYKSLVRCRLSQAGFSVSL